MPLEADFRNSWLHDLFLTDFPRQQGIGRALRTSSLRISWCARHRMKSWKKPQLASAKNEHHQTPLWGIVFDCFGISGIFANHFFEDYMLHLGGWWARQMIDDGWSIFFGRLQHPIRAYILAHTHTDTLYIYIGIRATTEFHAESVESKVFTLLGVPFRLPLYLSLQHPDQ